MSTTTHIAQARFGTRMVRGAVAGVAGGLVFGVLAGGLADRAAPVLGAGMV